MTVSGETIDYGPCAFLDHYDPAAVFSSIDEGGRYAFGNQPQIALWNLTRLAEALLPLLAEDEAAAVREAEDALSTYAGRFEAAFHDGLRTKLGLASAQEGDLALARDLLAVMAANGADFTLTFRALGAAAGGQAESERVRERFINPTAIDPWLARWRERLSAEAGTPAARQAAMDRVNPAFIPRNHRVEAMIRAAIEEADFGPFETLLAILARPFDDQPEHAAYQEPPADHERVLRTFCGT
jgi:uncharacterized protein YdiU (UPF0061 family)